jgi:hypothetical protein
MSHAQSYPNGPQARRVFRRLRSPRSCRSLTRLSRSYWPRTCGTHSRTTLLGPPFPLVPAYRRHDVRSPTLHASKFSVSHAQRPDGCRRTPCRAQLQRGLHRRCHQQPGLGYRDTLQVIAGSSERDLEVAAVTAEQ